MEVTKLCANPRCRKKFKPVTAWQKCHDAACANRWRVQRCLDRKRNGGGPNGGGGGKSKQLSLLDTSPAKGKPPKPVRESQKPLFAEADQLVATVGGAYEQRADGSVSDKNRYSVKKPVIGAVHAA